MEYNIANNLIAELQKELIKATCRLSADDDGDFSVRVEGDPIISRNDIMTVVTIANKWSKYFHFCSTLRYTPHIVIY